jgi:carbon storage regulator
MIKLTRRAGEAVMIGNDVSITILSVHNNQVEIEIDTPKQVSVYWVEIYNKTDQENYLEETVIKGAGVI